MGEYRSYRCDECGFDLVEHSGLGQVWGSYDAARFHAMLSSYSTFCGMDDNHPSEWIVIERLKKLGKTMDEINAETVLWIVDFDKETGKLFYKTAEGRSLSSEHHLPESMKCPKCPGTIRYSSVGSS